MIPSLISGDYQTFFNSLSLFPMITNLKQVIFIIIKVLIHEFNSLRKNGDYRSFINLLSLNPSDYGTMLNLLLTDEQIQIVTSAMEPSLTSVTLLTVTIILSNASSVDDSPTTRVIALVSKLSWILCRTLLAIFVQHLLLALYVVSTLF
ncbi:unnamed protein product [Arabidopsis thaliana]|uniref:Uncharacterized protein n=1 Tax=Arabidopsis thaliana TaxID=3702 RepID=A0A654ET84_ARATH|nr:unnamed protein product [Arabidopsis thaliana]